MDFPGSLQSPGSVSATLKDHGTATGSVVQEDHSGRRAWGEWGSLVQMDNSADSGSAASRSKEKSSCPGNPIHSIFQHKRTGLWRAGPIKWHWSNQDSIKYFRQSGVT